MPIPPRSSARPAALVLVLAVLAACGGDSSAASADAEPYIPEHVDGTGILSTLNSTRTSTDILPATGQRGLVLNNCATCHAVVCATLGQRTRDQWQAVEDSHRYYIPGLSMEDFGKIFDYLGRHFNDTLPEPAVPADLLGDGCPKLGDGPAAAAPAFAH